MSLLLLQLAFAKDIAFLHQPIQPGTKLDEQLVHTRKAADGWTRTEESLRFKVADDHTRLQVRSALRTSSESPKAEPFGLHDTTHVVTGTLTEEDRQGLSIAAVDHMQQAGAVGSGLHGVALTIGDALDEAQREGFEDLLGPEVTVTLKGVEASRATFAVQQPDAEGTLVLDARSGRLVAMDVVQEDADSGELRTLRFERTLTWSKR